MKKFTLHLDFQTKYVLQRIGLHQHEFLSSTMFPNSNSSLIIIFNMFHLMLQATNRVIELKQHLIMLHYPAKMCHCLKKPQLWSFIKILLVVIDK